VYLFAASLAAFAPLFFKLAISSFALVNKSANWLAQSPAV
jgi:hypothetical protein